MFVGQKFKEIILSSTNKASKDLGREILINGYCTCGEGVECLNISTLKKGDKVRITDNKANNVGVFGFVEVGDVATYTGVHYENRVLLNCGDWEESVWFLLHQIELVSTDQTEICKSRWDEIIDNLTSNSEMSKAEIDLVKSVLKNNIPYEVVPDPTDPIIEKGVQTHLDANFVGKTGNPHFYYKSEILNTWFCWDDDYNYWQECDFEDVRDDDFIVVKFD